MLWKWCTQYASKFGKFSSGHRTGKGQFSFQSLRKAMPKNVQTNTQLRSSHMLAKQYSKYSKPGFKSTWTVNFQMFKLDLEKAEEPESNCQHHLDHRKTRELQKIIYFCQNILTVWITTNCEKFLKGWEYQTTWPAFWEICMQVKKQQLKLDMEQQTDSKLGKVYVRLYHPAYLTYLQSTSCKMQGWMKHKLESRLPGEISITSDMQMTPPLWQKVKKN